MRTMDTDFFTLQDQNLLFFDDNLNDGDILTKQLRQFIAFAKVLNEKDELRIEQNKQFISLIEILTNKIELLTKRNGELEKQFELLDTENKQLKEHIEKLNIKLKYYEEQLLLAKQREFGASSEKTPPGDPESQSESPPESHINEVEEEKGEHSAEHSTEEEDTEYTEVKGHKRKKSIKRENKFENLRTETIEYHIPEEDQTCSCCGGSLHEMSTQVRKELKIIPAEVIVVEHVQHVYACRCCEKKEISTPIITAPMPDPVFPKSLASPSSMAYCMTQKYVESLPLYRQEKHFERLGIFLSRQMLANWITYGAHTWLKSIFDRMYYYLLLQEVLHADETRLQVLREKGRSATSTSYFWLYRTGRQDPAIVLYEYQQTREGKHPTGFLTGFKGYLHVDGYAGYHSIPGAVLVGCWAHARRNFTAALKALPKEKSHATVTAREGLDFCNKLFYIERDLKDVTDDERYQERLNQSMPILKEFFDWLQDKKPKVLPKSVLGSAIQYCLNQWDKLKSFLQDGRLEIDNNRSERSIKPVVIGRKNWLFSNTAKGAEASAIIYSVIETAKENGLNPFTYLTYLFEQLPNIDITVEENLDKLLPWSPCIPDTCRVPNKPS